MRTIVLSAGGTGGHVVPAIAIAEHLIKRGYRVVWIGDERVKHYADMFPKGVDVVLLDFTAYRAIGHRGVVRRCLSLLRLLWCARGALRRVQPHCVVGFGGYPTVPVLLAAWLRRIPFILHEQNSMLGGANKAFAFMARKIAVSYPNVVRRYPHKTIYTGIPLLSSIVDKSRAAPPYAAPLANAPIHVLITGGSQGARALSTFVPQALVALPADLRARLRIVQQARADDQAQVVHIYNTVGIKADVRCFFYDIADRLLWAHMVIMRAGALSIAEVVAIGRPAFFIPLVRGRAGGEQSVNAQRLVSMGAAQVFFEADLAKDTACLSNALGDVFNAPATLVSMAQAATQEQRVLWSAGAAMADAIESTLCEQ